MSFLAPLFLVGAAAAAVPIVLHLLKRDPDVRVKFAAVRLLKQAPVEDTERHHLRELLLLALRVAALVLLAIAFARPFLPKRAAAASSRVTVVALDTSYSLDAPGRFERAKALAASAIDRAPAGDLVGVVTFADEATIAARPSGDRVLAHAAVRDASVGFGSTRYRAALATAAQALGGRAGTIVLVTDLQESGWDAGDRAIVPEGASIEIADVGAMPPNLAVTSVRAAGDRVVATIRNAASTARDARVHLTVDGRPAGDATAALGPNQSGDVSFARASGRAAAVSVDDPAGIQADNTRYALVESAAAAPVAVVTGSGDLSGEAFYLQHALAAGGARGYRPVGLSGATLSTLAAGGLNEYAAIVLVSTRGLERRGRELIADYVRSGGGLVLAVGPEIDADLVADVLGGDATLRVSPVAPVSAGPARAFAPADVRHPVFQPFASNAAALGLVRFRQAARVEGRACQTIARFTTGDAAMLDCAAGDGRALVLASDLNDRWNDFPLHATFVPFVQEAVRYAGSAREQASEYSVADAPKGVARRPGVVAIADARAGAVPRAVAINVDPRESDPARLSADEFQSAITRMKDAGSSEVRGEARQQEDRQHLWQYAIALMAIALVAEGLLAARTV
ncbi:MAG TPA: BatA domain-containing protein [Vicinamibacterales bacterium]|nr:BatA domain-containing protein [Vicinamibacterales bacterium]